MKKLKISILIIIILATIIGGWFFKVTYIGQNGSDEAVQFTVEQGSSLTAITKELKSANIVSSTYVFKSYVKKKGLDTQIKAGTYDLTPSDSLKSIAEILTISGSAKEKNITILEGWNLREIAESLIKQGVISEASEMYKLTGYPTEANNTQNEGLATLYSFSSSIPAGQSLEGYFFPDTYRIAADGTVNDVLTKAFDNFEKKFNEDIKDQLLTSKFNLYQVLTLASIVNKEARTYEGKQKVAGVFYNRLSIDMALQSDPTVNYITQKTTDNPSLDDIDIDSPYNTYKYAGLPPGPISNPGLDDILAVLNPIDHNFFYFINTKEGDLIFSTTFEEHKANRIKYGQ